MDDKCKFVTKPLGKRLVTFEDFQEAGLVKSVLSHGLRVGFGMASCGMFSDHFFRLGDIYNSPVGRDELVVFHNLLIAKIKQVMEIERTTRIGLIIQRDGSAGIEQIGGLLAGYGLSHFKVILGQRLWAKALHPQIAREIREKKTRILLLTDTVFSGADIYEAALILQRVRFGFSVPDDPGIAAFVVYDYLRGAEMKLHMKDITLYSLIDWFFFRDLRLLPDRDIAGPIGCPTHRLQFESTALAVFAVFR
ncbi:MAG: hypothetical protein Q8L68_01850 [Methylococcales bacterium]|nr:hypothetical protein [Methylococcales bacterium]